MPFPRWVARLNARFTNRFAEPVARRVQANYAIVHHRGRSSGRWHRTPVLAFPRGDTRFIALTYGREADWVRNVLAGPAILEEGDGTRLPVLQPEIVDRTAGWDAIGWLYRPVLRLLRVRHLVRFEVGAPARPTTDGPKL